MNIILPLRFLKPTRISLPKTCKTVSETKKVVIKELKDKQDMLIDSGAVLVAKIDMDNNMVLLVWHMINDGVCEVDFRVKMNKNVI
ncbi:MAG: hypothetical protein AABW67_02490 [Nanoarchaeota archaeon]